MLYTDSFFLLLLALVCLISRLLGRWPAVKEWFLIAFSLFVIATWGTYDLVLFLGVLTVNFFVSLALPRLSPSAGRALLYAAIALDVGTLALFKYANFLGGIFDSMTGLHIPAFPLGIPLAISFYTFHIISYLVDLYKKRVQVASFRKYLFYLSFFPHVIAGPIVRAWQLIPQIGVIRRARNDWVMGTHYLVTGFFLKAVVANNLASYLDPIWTHSEAKAFDDFKLTTAEHWVVAFFYYCQIYGDFAGYTLMALGMARLLGYRLPGNFRSPMRAASLQEFWHRWHITLSRWLRDYLYFPLGGSRVSAARQSLNLIITMLLGGLWHGAGWGFLVWGAMHGGGMAAERALGCRNLPPNTVRRWGWWIVTQMWVTLAWVVFREPTLSNAWRFARNMFEPTFASIVGSPLYHVRPSLLVPLIFAVPVVIHQCVPFILQRIGRRNLGIALGGSTAVMLILNLTVYSPTKSFIYFRF
jgi:alginate O-acetyltransferase complex protein AlgI